MPITQGKILEGSTVHTDGWGTYEGLVVNGVDPYRAFQGKNEFARGKSYVVEAFWSCTERRCAKFNGLRGDVFLLHLKECEFRYSNRGENLLSLLTNLVK
jgi:transposase-like protein